MENNKKIAVFIAGLILVGMLITLLFPKESRRNTNAPVRIGAGDDVSGILMEAAAEELSGEFEVSQGFESSSFQDC